MNVPVNIYDFDIYNSPVLFIFSVVCSFSHKGLLEPTQKKNSQLKSNNFWHFNLIFQHK